MEARLFRAVVCAAAALLSLGASYRTNNFIVDAATPELAQEMCEAAEKYRHDLAIEWLGKPLPDWQEPCPIRVTVGERMGAGGATSFMFDRGRPFGWTMSVQGTRQRVLDSVLPHEVTHAIFATHFGRPLPRWADEGACTTVEHESERKKQEENLLVFLTTKRGIAFNQMFAMTEYPSDVLPLYSQGYSLARFLIAQGGKRKFVDYVGDGMQMGNWSAATKKHYGFENLSELQLTWVEWVRNGSRDEEAVTIAQGKRNGQTPAATVASADARSRESDNTSATPIKLASTTISRDQAATTQEQAAPASPAARPQGGWYARRRDEARARSTLATGGSGEALGARPLDTSREELPRGIVVSRPQPVERPQQTIVEWTRPPQPSTLPQTSLVPSNTIRR